MSIKEFVDAGILQEANRRFFHPLGLALSVRIDHAKDNYALEGIWDYRHDPEGILFSEKVIRSKETTNKASKFSRFRVRKASKRKSLLGFVIQPLPKPKKN